VCPCLEGLGHVFGVSLSAVEVDCTNDRRLGSGWSGVIDERHGSRRWCHQDCDVVVAGNSAADNFQQNLPRIHLD